MNDEIGNALIPGHKGLTPISAMSRNTLEKVCCFHDM